MKRHSILGLLALSPALALASIVPSGTTIGGSGPYSWTYSLQQVSDPRVQPLPPFRALSLEEADRGFTSFFTIHDFEGYVAGSCAGPSGWICSALSGDDSSVVDLTWAYASVSGVVRTLDVGELGEFSALSIYDSVTTVSYAARTFDAYGSRQGWIAENTGSTQGPTANGVPEPGSLVLAGLGLALVGWARRRPGPHPAV